jgi:hypothetical protein
MARIEVRERMRALLERWRRSGETAAAFCRRQGINPQKLSYWKRALGLAGPVARRRPAGRRAGRFVPLQLVGANGSMGGGTVEIVLASGERVVLREGASRELLREALEVLREPRC